MTCCDMLNMGGSSACTGEQRAALPYPHDAHALACCCPHRFSHVPPSQGSLRTHPPPQHVTLPAPQQGRDRQQERVQEHQCGKPRLPAPPPQPPAWQPLRRGRQPRPRCPALPRPQCRNPGKGGSRLLWDGCPYRAVNRGFQGSRRPQVCGPHTPDTCRGE
jgi:hypothetical protein